MAENNRFSENVTVFRKYTLPETDMKLAGYSALINRYDLEVPLYVKRHDKMRTFKAEHFDMPDKIWKIL